MNIKIDPILRRMREVDDPSTGFPTTADDGDIMMFQRGEDRGNTTFCKFLLQPSQSGNSLVDSAAGNETPVAITNAGLTLDENGDIIIAAGTHATIAANTFSTDILVPDKEWVVDVLVRIDSYSSGGAFFGYRYVHKFNFAFDPNGNRLLFADDAGDIEVAYTMGSWALMTLEHYYNSANAYWVQAAYLNGAFVGVKNNAPISAEAGRGVTYGIGAVPEYWYGDMSGRIRAIRIRNVAPYQGVSFVPQALPWLPPGPGSWQKTSLATLKAKLEALA